MRYFILSAAFAMVACDSPPTQPREPKAVSLPVPSLLSQQKNCIACHNAVNNMVGPSWKTIAAKYQNDISATNRLVDKVLKGGSGSFGAIVMPPQSMTLKPEEAQHLVKWILKGAPN